MNLHNGVSIIDWNYYEKKAKSMSDDALRYSIEDCKQAIEAQKGIEGQPNDRGLKYAGFYQDEIHVYSGELRRRNEKLKKKDV